LKKFSCSVDPRLGLAKERLALWWQEDNRGREGWALLVWRTFGHDLRREFSC
jgi:hypothetical protein